MKPITQWTTSDIIALIKSLDKKTWAYIGAGTLAVFVLGYFFIWPAWVKRPQLKNEIDALNLRIVGVEQLKRNRPRWLEEKESYKKYIADVQDRLYSPGETSLLLGVVSKLAHESDVSIISSRPMDKKTNFPAPFNQRYAAELYDFTVEGDFHSLGAFISRIEDNAKLLRVERFTVNPREKSVNSHIATLIVSAVSDNTKTAVKGEAPGVVK